MRKDDYLMTMMQVPPKQRIAISPFDQRTQREAFSVSLEGLKGVRVHFLLREWCCVFSVLSRSLVVLDGLGSMIPFIVVSYTQPSFLYSGT